MLGLSIVACAGEPAFAQSRGLSANVKTLSLTARSGAAIPLEWKMLWSGRGILEGRLKYSVHVENRLVGEFQSGDIVLSGGVKRFRTMLPPFNVSNNFSQVTLKATFVSKSKSYELPEALVRIPQPMQRAFSVCVCRSSNPSAAAGAWNTGFERSLKFERFDPQKTDRSLLTVLSNVAPEDMPEGNAHAYCGFDLVVLTVESLQALRKRQLDSIRAWLNAGGSLVVVPGGTLEPYHAEFLNDVARTGAARRPFVLGDDGQLTGLRDNREIMLVRKGLGRVAVILGPAPEKVEFDSPRWKRMVWFLWKMQREFLQPILVHSRWRTTNLKKLQVEYDGFPEDVNQRLPPTQPQDYHPEQVNPTPLPSGSWLLQRLLPDSINVVPLSVIGLILFVYLLVVGPADFFILGKLKLRKYTWVVFPVVTLMFAGFTVWLSERYMQADDRRRSLVFLDVGDDGTIVRANQIDLIFTGTHRRMETDVRRGLFTAMNHQAFAEEDDLSGLGFGFGVRSRRQRTANGVELQNSSLVGPPTYSGNVPGRYSVMQSIPQWTPQMNRILRIAPDEQKPKFDFNSIPMNDFASETRLAEHGRRISAAFGADASAYFIYKGEFKQFSGPLRDFTHMREYEDDQIMFTSGPADQSATGNFIRDVCVRPQSGLFSIVSQISPAGGRTFEDLALHDATDPQQWLLLIIVRRGDRQLVYRKLYVAEDR